MIVCVIHYCCCGYFFSLPSTVGFFSMGKEVCAWCFGAPSMFFFQAHFNICYVAIYVKVYRPILALNIFNKIFKKNIEKNVVYICVPIANIYLFNRSCHNELRTIKSNERPQIAGFFLFFLYKLFNFLH